MKISNYIKDGRQFIHVANIRQIGAARELLNAVQIKRDELREQKETRPMMCPDNLKKDMVFQTGAIWALNWVLSLPEEARKFIDKLPNDQF